MTSEDVTPELNVLNELNEINGTNEMNELNGPNDLNDLNGFNGLNDPTFRTERTKVEEFNYVIYIWRTRVDSQR